MRAARLNLLEKSCYKFPAAGRPSDGKQEDDRGHDEVALIRVLRWASAGLGLVVRAAQPAKRFP